MIPKISQGDRFSGLLMYLVGPGKANEHEDPHLVAARAQSACDPLAERPGSAGDGNGQLLFGVHAPRTNGAPGR